MPSPQQRAAATPPEPRAPGRYHVEFVCTGNICRSPSADVVLRRMLADAGLTSVRVTSSGLAGWHIGEPIDLRSGRALVSAGYDPSDHRARKWRDSDLPGRDLVLAMDAGHLQALPASPRVRLFRDFDPVAGGADVPDPYYGGPSGFREVLVMVERTCRSLVGAITAIVEVAPVEGARVDGARVDGARVEGERG